MFKQPLFPKIAIDASIRGVLLAVILNFLLSGYMARIPVLGAILIIVLAVIPVISGWYLCRGESGTRILGFAFASFPLSFILTFFLLMFSITLPIWLFPTDYMSAASSSLVFVITPFVLLFTGLLRIVVFVFLMLKKYSDKPPKVRSGSLMNRFYSWLIYIRVETDWKRVRKNACIVLILYFALYLLLIFSLSSCTPNYEQRIPIDGVWYCEELQAQFTIYKRPGYVDPDWRPVADEQGNYVDENESYVIIDGDRIAASWGNDRGSIRVVILCNEERNPNCYLGEVIYAFNFVSLSDTKYVLEADDGTQYTFVRIGDTPSSDSQSDN